MLVSIDKGEKVKIKIDFVGIQKYLIKLCEKQ
jgi:hypothetical protein